MGSKLRDEWRENGLPPERISVISMVTKIPEVELWQMAVLSGLLMSGAFGTLFEEFGTWHEIRDSVFDPEWLPVGPVRCLTDSN